jgi:hypothetical protein
MGINRAIKKWAFALFIIGGGLMAEQSKQSPSPQPRSQHWLTIEDDKTGFKIDFPHRPLEMTFEVPFQNTPPRGQIHLYSVPMQSGLLAFSTYHSATVDSNLLQKEQFYQFFETILVPHFFFNPAVFQDQQMFHYHLNELVGKESASFVFSFLDHQVVKKLEGIALLKDQILYLSFYLASEKDFDHEVLHRFLTSMQFPPH